jgi:hypothetical protein
VESSAKIPYSFCQQSQLQNGKNVKQAAFLLLRHGHNDGVDDNDMPYDIIDP